MSTQAVYTSREEIAVYRFTAAATIGLPLTAVFLQSLIPVMFHGRLHFFEIFDLPLLVTIFFGVARRNPALGTITGCLIGLTQDALTGNYLGLFGMAKSVVGYASSTIAGKIDVDNPGSRLILTFAFYMLHRLVYLLVQRGLVEQSLPGEWLHALGAALANGLLAIFLFTVLDRFKRRS
ncbi:MAG TPA: rod shape-determining protein MreD [Terriglobales bacterium]|nr:rod shape-determining protein MreD [Terriglobales bacterium]